MSREYVVAKLIELGASFEWVESMSHYLQDSGLSEAARNTLVECVSMRNTREDCPLAYHEYTLENMFRQRIEMVEWIDSLPLEDYTKVVLIKRYFKYQGSSVSWKKSVENMVGYIKEGCAC